MHGRNWRKLSMGVFVLTTLTALISMFSFPAQGIAGTFVSGLTAPTGLAIHPQQRLLYVKSGAGGTVWKVPILTGGKAGSIGVVTDQFTPSGDIKFDAAGNLYGIFEDSIWGACVARIDSSGSVCFARTGWTSSPDPGIAIESPGLSSSGIFFKPSYALVRATISSFVCNDWVDDLEVGRPPGPIRFLLYRPSLADLVGSYGTTVASINVSNGNASPLISDLAQPQGLAEDTQGNLYVVDSGAGAIFKRTPIGTVTKIIQGLSSPTGLVFDAANGNLYVAETSANRISYWAAGTAFSGGIYLSVKNASGTWANAVKLPGSITSPSDPAAIFDASGNLYVFVQASDNSIRMLKRDTSKVWGKWTKVPGGTTISGPTAAAEGNTIYLYRRGLDDALYLATLSSNGAWSAWKKVPGSKPTPAGPGSAKDSDGNQYLFSRGMK